jgi:hypothetical protein
VSEVAETEDLRSVAFVKISRVLGTERAEMLLERLLGELGHGLQTPNDLARLAEEMSRLPGFEGAVGAMLGVEAVLRGARTR